MNNEVNKERRKWSNKLVKFLRLSNNMLEITVIREIKDVHKMSLKKCCESVIENKKKQMDNSENVPLGNKLSL